MLFTRGYARDQAFKITKFVAPTAAKVHMASHGHSPVSLDLANFARIGIVHDPLTNLHGNV